MFGNQCFFSQLNNEKGGREISQALYFSRYARITEKHLFSVSSGEIVEYHCVLLYQHILFV